MISQLTGAFGVPMRAIVQPDMDVRCKPGFRPALDRQQVASYGSLADGDDATTCLLSPEDRPHGGRPRAGRRRGSCSGTAARGGVGGDGERVDVMNSGHPHGRGSSRPSRPDRWVHPVP
jgi:hypothetical protein